MGNVTFMIRNELIRNWQKRVFSAVFGLAAAVLLTWVIAPVTLAQTTEPAALKNVRIWVNPEYDDQLKLNVPGVLIMMEGQIASAQLPLTTRFLVPTTAQMYSAGSKNASGAYLPPGNTLTRTASSVTGWDEISYQLTTDTFRVEYYQPITQVGQIQKSFSYEFLRTYTVQDLSVTVQQPKSSDNFTVSPSGRPGIDSEGFNVQTYKFTNLDVSTPVKFSISYNRSVWEPSLGTSTTSGTNSGSSGSKSNTGLIVAVVAVAVVLGGGGVYLMSRSGQKSKEVSRAERRRRATATTRSRPTTNSEVPAFCSQCGHKLDKPSRFCPNCGTPI